MELTHGDMLVIGNVTFKFERGGLSPRLAKGEPSRPPLEPSSVLESQLSIMGSMSISGASFSGPVSLVLKESSAAEESKEGKEKEKKEESKPSSQRKRGPPPLPPSSPGLRFPESLFPEELPCQAVSACHSA